MSPELVQKFSAPVPRYTSYPTSTATWTRLFIVDGLPNFPELPGCLSTSIFPFATGSAGSAAATPSRRIDTSQ